MKKTNITSSALKTSKPKVGIRYASSLLLLLTSHKSQVTKLLLPEDEDFRHAYSYNLSSRTAGLGNLGPGEQSYAPVSVWSGQASESESEVFHKDKPSS